MGTWTGNTGAEGTSEVFKILSKTSGQIFQKTLQMTNMIIFTVFCFFHSVLSSPAPQTEGGLSVSDWLGAIPGIISQVGSSQEFKQGIATAQERVSNIQENIPENFTTTLRDSFFNILQQQQENIPANLTSTLRDNFLTIIQQQNMTDNIPAVRSFIQDNAANLTLPEGVNLQSLLSALPAEEASTNLRSSVTDNIPDRDTINTGIQTVLDIIPENALDTAGSLLTNLFGR